MDVTLPCQNLDDPNELVLSFGSNIVEAELDSVSSEVIVFIANYQKPPK